MGLFMELSKVVLCQGIESNAVDLILSLISNSKGRLHTQCQDVEIYRLIIF